MLMLATLIPSVRYGTPDYIFLARQTHSLFEDRRAMEAVLRAEIMMKDSAKQMTNRTIM
jgi:hypothetical protein